MNINDPVSDMLTRIRNANMVGKKEVSMPSTKVICEVARVMQEEGYIEGYTLLDTTPRKTLSVALKYSQDNKPAVKGLKRISKPGLRIYSHASELPRVLGGLGTAIISTSKGMMSDRDARIANIGGEVLAYVW